MSAGGLLAGIAALLGSGALKAVEDGKRRTEEERKRIRNSYNFYIPEPTWNPTNGGNQYAKAVKEASPYIFTDCVPLCLWRNDRTIHWFRTNHSYMQLRKFNKLIPYYQYVINDGRYQWEPDYYDGPLIKNTEVNLDDFLSPAWVQQDWETMEQYIERIAAILGYEVLLIANHYGRNNVYYPGHCIDYDAKTRKLYVHIKDPLQYYMSQFLFENAKFRNNEVPERVYNYLKILQASYGNIDMAADHEYSHYLAQLARCKHVS